MEVYVNMRRRGRQILLAICDAELLGKTFRESNTMFEVREDFYKGFKTSVEEAMDFLEECTIANLAGSNVVKKAIEKGHVHPEAVINVCGVLHAQIVKM